MNENKIDDLKLTNEQAIELFHGGIIYALLRTSCVLEDNSEHPITQEYIELLRNALYATLKVRAGDAENRNLLKSLSALNEYIRGVEDNRIEFLYRLEEIERAINKQYLRALAYNPNDQK